MRVSHEELMERVMELAEEIASYEDPVCVIGQPGVGKTMAAVRVAGFMPKLTGTDRAEVKAIYAAAGMDAPWKLEDLTDLNTNRTGRPTRAPHHSVSKVALVGRHGLDRPSEVALAHEGVLVLDELPEFRRDALEGVQACYHAGADLDGFNARFRIVGTASLCPCGFHGTVSGWSSCSCSEAAVENYRQRVLRALGPKGIIIPFWQEN